MEDLASVFVELYRDIPRTHTYRTCRCKTANTRDRIIDSLFLLAGALLRYVSWLFEVSSSTLAYPRFRPPPLGTDALRYSWARVLQLFQPADPNVIHRAALTIH